jgi:hypothetical protein
MTETWTTPKGSTITIETEHNNGIATICNLTINGKVYSARYNKVAKTAEIKMDGREVSVILSRNIWEQIEAAKANSFQQVEFSAKELARQKMEHAKAEYDKAFAVGYDNVDIINKRNAWDESSRIYRETK